MPTTLIFLLLPQSNRVLLVALDVRLYDCCVFLAKFAYTFICLRNIDIVDEIECYYEVNESASPKNGESIMCTYIFNFFEVVII